MFDIDQQNERNPFPQVVGLFENRDKRQSAKIIMGMVKVFQKLSTISGASKIFTILTPNFVGGKTFFSNVYSVTFLHSGDAYK